MKKILKSVLNLPTLLTCYVGAIGYGVGYYLPNKYDLHPIICLICCFAFGTVFDKLAQRIVKSKYFNKSKQNKIVIAIVMYIGYLIAWLIVYNTLNHDLDDDFMLSLYMILAIQVVLLIYKNVVETIKEKKTSQTTKINDKKLDGVQGGTLIRETPKDNVRIDAIEINGEIRNREDPYQQKQKGKNVKKE